jgi:hypothetical protein
MESGYQPPEGYVTIGQAREQLRVSHPTLRRLLRDADPPVEVFEDPRDTRVKLLRAADVIRLAQPRKSAA